MRCISAEIIGIRISSSKSEEGGEKTARKPCCLCLTFSSQKFAFEHLSVLIKIWMRMLNTTVANLCIFEVSTY